jgi:porphobilinogen deaminase
MKRQMKTGVIAAIIAAAATIIVAAINLIPAYTKKESSPPPPTAVTVNVNLTSDLQEIRKAVSNVNNKNHPVETWRRLDSDEQKGFYETQLNELERKLTAARVAPDGVKFMFGIGVNQPHLGWISVFLREGDNQPFRYSIKKDTNSGDEGAVEKAIITKLQGGAVLPIGWTYHSESFIYATAELQR